MWRSRLINLHSRNFRPLVTSNHNLTMPSPEKILKQDVNYIGTHDNTFHCDDVTACFMLKTLTRFRNHDIVRTRNADLLAKAEIIVDVGGELDVGRLRLDHHQRSFNQTIKDYHPKLKVTNPDKPVRLSSAGLVYAIFGKELIAQLLNLESPYDKLGEEERKMVDAIYEKAYIEFFEEIDAIDNGVEVASGDSFVYNYHINSGISSRVGRLNPTDDVATPELRLDQFKKAMQMVGDELTEGIKFLGSQWWPQRQRFKALVKKSNEFHPSGQVIFLGDELGVGAKSHILEIEEEMGIVGQIKFYIYCDGSAASPWRALAIPEHIKTFASRMPLKEEWRGLRDEELQKVSGVPDATFVHMSGFTGGAKSMEGIRSLVFKTLGLE